MTRSWIYVLGISFLLFALSEATHLTRNRTLTREQLLRRRTLATSRTNGNTVTQRGRGSLNGRTGTLGGTVGNPRTGLPTSAAASQRDIDRVILTPVQDGAVRSLRNLLSTRRGRGNPRLIGFLIPRADGRTQLRLMRGAEQFLRNRRGDPRGNRVRMNELPFNIRTIVAAARRANLLPSRNGTRGFQQSRRIATVGGLGRPGAPGGTQAPQTNSDSDNGGETIKQRTVNIEVNVQSPDAPEPSPTPQNPNPTVANQGMINPNQQNGFMNNVGAVGGFNTAFNQRQQPGTNMINGLNTLNPANSGNSRNNDRPADGTSSSSSNSGGGNINIGLGIGIGSSSSAAQKPAAQKPAAQKPASTNPPVSNRIGSVLNIGQNTQPTPTNSFQQGISNQQTRSIPFDQSAFSGGPQIGLLGIPQTGFPSNPPTGFPNNPPTGFPGNSQTSFPGNTQNAFPGNTQTSFPGNTQTSFPGNTQNAFPGNSQTAFSGNPQTGFPANTQISFPSNQQTGFPTNVQFQTNVNNPSFPNLQRFDQQPPAVSGSISASNSLPWNTFPSSSGNFGQDTGSLANTNTFTNNNQNNLFSNNAQLSNVNGMQRQTNLRQDTIDTAQANQFNAVQPQQVNNLASNQNFANSQMLIPQSSTGVVGSVAGGLDSVQQNTILQATGSALPSDPFSSGDPTIGEPMIIDNGGRTTVVVDNITFTGVLPPGPPVLKTQVINGKGSVHINPVISSQTPTNSFGRNFPTQLHFSNPNDMNSIDQNVQLTAENNRLFSNQNLLGIQGTQGTKSPVEPQMNKDTSFGTPTSIFVNTSGLLNLTKSRRNVNMSWVSNDFTSVVSNATNHPQMLDISIPLNINPTSKSSTNIAASVTGVSHVGDVVNNTLAGIPSVHSTNITMVQGIQTTGILGDKLPLDTNPVSSQPHIPVASTFPNVHLQGLPTTAPPTILLNDIQPQLVETIPQDPTSLPSPSTGNITDPLAQGDGLQTNVPSLAFSNAQPTAMDPDPFQDAQFLELQRQGHILHMRRLALLKRREEQLNTLRNKLLLMELTGNQRQPVLRKPLTQAKTQDLKILQNIKPVASVPKTTASSSIAFMNVDSLRNMIEDILYGFFKKNDIIPTGLPFPISGGTKGSGTVNSKPVDLLHPPMNSNSSQLNVTSVHINSSIPMVQSTTSSNTTVLPVTDPNLTPTTEPTPPPVTDPNPTPVADPSGHPADVGVVTSTSIHSTGIVSTTASPLPSTTIFFTTSSPIIMDSVGNSVGQPTISGKNRNIHFPGGIAVHAEMSTLQTPHIKNFQRSTLSTNTWNFDRIRQGVNLPGTARGIVSSIPELVGGALSSTNARVIAEVNRPVDSSNFNLQFNRRLQDVAMTPNIETPRGRPGGVPVFPMQ